VATDLIEPAMATEKPKTLPVKLHGDVIESARVVSALRGEQMQDMISDILRPILAKMEQEERTKRVTRGKPSRPKRGKVGPETEEWGAK